MKLPEAIILGDTLKKSNPAIWLNGDGSCGCAFGGAILAAGLADGYSADRMALYVDENCNLEPDESVTVIKAWPWLTKEILSKITRLYSAVCRNEATIEDVADYVRGIEPADQSSTSILDSESVLQTV